MRDGGTFSNEPRGERLHLAQFKALWRTYITSELLELHEPRGRFIHARSPLEPGVPEDRMKPYYLHLEGSVLGGDCTSVLWDFDVKTTAPILQFEVFFYYYFF